MPEPVVLVGRDEEIAALRTLVHSAGSGHGAVVLVAGEAGAGKTTLVHAGMGHEPVDLLTAASVPGGSVAFGPIIEAFRGYLRSGDAAALASGPLADHLARLLPELGPAAAGGDRATLLEAIRLGLARIAVERPGRVVTVFLDDLQWADNATIELLPALARSAQDLPLLIVAAFRSDELPRTHLIRRVRGELRRAGLLHQIVVEPLGPRGTSELLSQILGTVSPAVSRAVFDRTDGLPFFIHELGSALTSNGRLVPGPSGMELTPGQDLPLPESVRDAVLLQAAQLSEPARSVLSAAAVAGHSFDPELVTTIAQQREWPQEVLRLGFVQETGNGRMTFRHGLIREAFYADIPWSRRVGLHAGVAEQLEGSSAAPAVIAEHWALGRQPERARRWNLIAAEQFCAVHAYRDAVRSSRLALDQWPDDDAEQRLAVLERMAHACELGGELADAATAWREVIERLARQPGQEGRSAIAYRRLAATLEMLGRWTEALASRDRAALAFGAAQQPGEAAAELLVAAAHLRSAGSFRAAIGLLEPAKEQARQSGRVDLEARILGHEGNARARLGEGEPAVEMVRSGLALALDHGLTGAAADIYQRLADALEHCGDYGAAKDTYHEAFNFCSVNGIEPTAQLCLACLTSVLRQSGDWDRAVMLCRQVLASPDASTHARAAAAGMYGSILGQRGQTKRARPLLLEAAALSRQIELSAMELMSAWGLAIVDEVEGATESAAAHCHSMLQRWQQTEDRHYAVGPLRWATTFFAETGDAASARTCAASLAQLAAGAEHGEVMSALAHALGETAWLDGNLEQAAEHFIRAVALLDGVEAPFDRAESQRRAGSALAGLGRREEAVEQLVAAHRLARRLEARPLLARVAADLAGGGRRGAPTGARRAGRAKAGTAGGSRRGQRRAHPARDRSGAAGRGRCDQPGDRPGAVPQPAHGGDPRQQHRAEAELPIPGRRRSPGQ